MTPLEVLRKKAQMEQLKKEQDNPDVIQSIDSPGSYNQPTEKSVYIYTQDSKGNKTVQIAPKSKKETEGCQLLARDFLLTEQFAAYGSRTEAKAIEAPRPTVEASRTRELTLRDVVRFIPVLSSYNKTVATSMPTPEEDQALGSMMRELVRIQTTTETVSNGEVVALIEYVLCDIRDPAHFSGTLTDKIETWQGISDRLKAGMSTKADQTGRSEQETELESVRLFVQQLSDTNENLMAEKRALQRDLEGAFARILELERKAELEEETAWTAPSPQPAERLDFRRPASSAAPRNAPVAKTLGDRHTTLLSRRANTLRMPTQAFDDDRSIVEDFDWESETAESRLPNTGGRRMHTANTYTSKGGGRRFEANYDYSSDPDF